MAKKQSCLNKSGSFLGALLIEALSIVLMLSLFSIMQNQRLQVQAAEELGSHNHVSRAAEITRPQPNLVGDNPDVESQHSSRRLAPPSSVVLNRLPKFEWRVPVNFRR